MKITDLSILCKWETLKIWQCIKYLFAPLYVQVHFNKLSNLECGGKVISIIQLKL